MTARKKLPPADDWQARDINDWNTKTFHAYMIDEHNRIFGVDYVPFGGWPREQGTLGNLIGTRTKEATADKADVKRFIDECFASYKPTAEYPGTSFGFSWSYRKNVWQQVQAESNRRKMAQAKVEKQETDWDEVARWL